MNTETQNKSSKGAWSPCDCDTVAALLEGVADGVLVTDLEGCVLRCNPAAEVLTGRSAGEARGVPFAQVLGCDELAGSPLGREGFRGEWVEVTCRGRRADGRPLVLRVRARTLADPVGRPAGRAVLFSEISLHESLHQKIVAYERLASLGELAASLVHEIGNPVSVIVGFSHLLVQQHGADPGGEVRGRILREAERCQKIVGQLLSYASSAGPSARPAPLSLQNAVVEVVDLLRYKLNRKGVWSEIAWEPDTPLVVADSGEVKQVVLNLLLNALDATPQGGTVRVTGRRAERETTVGGDSLLSPVARVVREPWAELRVLDEGPGLGVGDPERFFAPFCTTKEKGGGLGLTVCRRIVAERGGQVRLENRPEGGACAVVELPGYRPASQSSYQ